MPSFLPGKTLIFAAALGLCAQMLCAKPHSFTDKLPPEELSALLVKEMSDEEVLGQTFMLGWIGEDPSPLILDWIAQRHIGGIKIFGWNTEDTARMVRSVGTMQKKSLSTKAGIPLIVATDQEGGWIRHVKGTTSETPGNMAIGASGFPEDSYWSGYYIAREIAALGINMNFAPSVDLYTNPKSVLIGPRSFGQNPVEAAILGAAFVKGQGKAGVISTAKHFPGHGDTELDSHGILPRIDVGFDTLWERELIPYRTLVKEGVPAIMSGHLAFPNTKAGREPASLSKWFLTDILRGKMGFKGLIITDDLMMGGATATTGTLSAASRRALEAGNDMLMYSKTPFMDDPVWTSLIWAYKNDVAFRSRVQDAARRVLVMKLTWLRAENAPPFVPDPQTIVKTVPKEEGRKFFQDLAARSVTVIKNAPFPLEPKKLGRVLLAGQFEEYFKAGSVAFPGARHYRFSYYPPDGAKPAEVAELVKQASAADTVVICLANRSSLELLEALRPLKKKVIVISTLSPVYLGIADWVDGSIAVYSYSSESFVAGFSAAVGRLKTQGVLPFTLGS